MIAPALTTASSLGVLPPTLFQWRHLWSRVCRWPEYYRPSEWADRFRVLDEKESAIPGPWSSMRNRPLAQLSDLSMMPHVRRVTWIKPPQIGASQDMRNIYATIIDQDPGPTMLVMPNEDLARELMGMHLSQMLKKTARLQRHLTGMQHDLKESKIITSRMVTKIGWATSAASLASFPARYIILDEVDRYPATLGETGSPIDLAEARTRTFIGVEKIFAFSTPTNQFGPIAKEMAKCPQVFRLWCPCPACGQLQLLQWMQIRWDCKLEDKVQRAAAVESEHLAYYECIHCGQRIHEIQRATMVREGIWWPGTNDDPLAFGPPDPTVKDVVEGFDRGVWPKVAHVGAYYPGIASPWITLHWIAARGILAMGDRLAQLSFKNNVLGEIFEENQIEAVKAEVINVKAENAPRASVVPRWAQLVICTVDTQHDHFWFVVRAWGFGYRSQLIAHGRVASFDDVLRVGIKAQYPRAALNGVDVDPSETVAPFFCLIDSGGTGDDIVGSRTNEVYQFTRTNPRQLIPLKGHPGGRAARAPFYFSRIDYTPRTPGVSGVAAYQINLMLIDVNFYKSILANRMKKAVTEVDYWAINDNTGRDYIRQMTSEHRVIDPKTGTATWRKISQQADNHFWDCEVYQQAAADMAQVNLLKPLDERLPLAAALQQESGYKFREPNGGAQDGWKIGR